MRLRISCFIICFISGASGLAAPAPCAAQTRRPSVVLVILDAVRADHTSPYGYSKSVTPALSALAEQASVFENAYSNSNWTGSSFASILTGKRPFAHGMVGSLEKLSPETPTIQSVLSRNGYETSFFFSGLSGAPEYGNGRGAGHVVAAEDRIPMSRQVASAIKWARELPAEKDYFILLHGNDAHAPYHCSSSATTGNGEFPELDGEFLGYYHGAPGWDLRLLDPEKWKRALALRENAAFLSSVSKAYDLCISREDQDLAVFLHGLETGSGRPLLVIVTADHGELLGEHGVIGHGRHYYEQVVRVPLLVRFPDGRKPGRIRELTEHVDLLPTICAATGVACPNGLDGKALSAGAGNADKSGRWAAAGDTKESLRTIIQSAAFTENGSKIILRNHRWQLFNLSSDPGETKDLAKESPVEFLKLAAGYLAFSGADKLIKAGMPDGKEGNCFLRRKAPPVARSTGTLSCQQARLETSMLARAGDFEGAAVSLKASQCPQAVVLKDYETLELLRQAAPPARAAARGGYKLSALPGSWKVEKDDFFVTYSAESGLICENGGHSVTVPACVPTAEALLNCVEYYRFRKKEKNEADTLNLREALKTAGYLP